MTEATKNAAWRRKLRHQLKREQHAKERAELAHIRHRISELTGERRRYIVRARVLSRTERARLSTIQKRELARIRHEREQLKRKRIQLLQRMKIARARVGRLRVLRTERGKTLHAEALAFLVKQRQEHAELLRALRALDQRKAVHMSGAERRAESDDAVRANIAADLVPIFDRVKKHIRPKSGRSRTEAFLEWVEAHPDELWTLHQERADKELRKLLAEEAQREVRLRKTERRMRELAAVPF